MTDKELTKVVYTALRSACKFMRTNPPGNICLYSPEMIVKCLCNETEDPEGEAYVDYFIAEAINKLSK